MKLCAQYFETENPLSARTMPTVQHSVCCMISTLPMLAHLDNLLSAYYVFSANDMKMNK